MEEGSDNKFKLSPEAKERYKGFFVEYVGSVKRLSELCLWSGGALTVVGVLLMRYELRRIGKVGNERTGEAARGSGIR